MNNNILLWNMHEIDTSHKRLGVLIKKYNFILVAILEPFMKDSDAMKRTRQILGFTKYCSNEIKGGKNWVMWDDKCTFEDVRMSDQRFSRWF